MLGNKFNNIFIPSDTNGTFFWRAQQQIQSVWALGASTGINNSVICRPVCDPKYYEDVDMVMVQRMLSDGQLNFVEKFLDPYSELLKFWVVYNIDDAMHYQDIPKYNRGRRAYVGEKVQENIRKMLNLSDFVLTTTDYIKSYYNRRYGVPLENIIAIPNFLPRWWFGHLYDKQKSIERFKRHKSKGKLRLGIISSLSHFNTTKCKVDKDGNVVYLDKQDDGSILMVDDNDRIITSDEGLVDVKDDLDIIVDTIKATVDRFQWVFLGYCPEALSEYSKSGKIEVHPGAVITNYPHKLADLDLDFALAPLVDNEFNRCKSNIKWLETSAVGVPLLASRIDPTYVKYMPENQMFRDENELMAMLKDLQTCSAARYESMVENQWKFINTPHHECGLDCPSWWLEDCLPHWMKLFKLRPKCSRFSLKKYLGVQKQKEDELSNRIMFSGDNGVMVYK